MREEGKGKREKKESIQISILGCGWLGLPLAKHLIGDGYLVKGSTTSVEKISILKESGIQPFLVTLSGVEGALSENGIEGNTKDFLENSQILIIDIPPKLRGENKENFVAKIKSLLPFIEKSSVEKVLFISSTSVYGEDNTMVTETAIPNPDTESGKQLLEAEQLLQKNTHFKTTVLRFGGLIGEDRHPIKHIAGRENLENPDGPINLIHQTDCIGIIDRIITLDSWNETFNAVAPFHPTRLTFYTEKATKLNLPLPKFTHEKPSSGKIISSEKVEKILQYQFKNNLS